MAADILSVNNKTRRIVFKMEDKRSYENLDSSPRMNFFRKDNNDGELQSSNSKHCCFITSWWSAFTKLIHNVICRGLIAVSVCAARHPMITILVIPLISFGLVIGGFATNFNVVSDSYLMFGPVNTPTDHHRSWVQEVGFPAEPAPFAMVIHADGENIAGRKGIERVFAAINAVRQTKGYDGVCDDKDNKCMISSITSFWNHNQTFFDESVKSDEDVFLAASSTTYPDGMPVDMGYLIDSSDLESVRAYFVYLFLPETVEAENVTRSAIDNVFELEGTWDDNVVIEVNTPVSFPDEFMKTIANDLPLIPLVVAIMSIFTCLVFIRRNPVESRSMLGIGSVVTILLSIVSGYGLLFLIGVPYTNLTTILPFVVFGIGLDDTFIITGHYFRLDTRIDPIDRLKETMSTVGMSIFVTTLTTSLAFIFGLISSVPAIYWLCLYSFPMIIIDFVYQITFFVALLMIDERRIQANRRDVCVCFVVSKDTTIEFDAETDNHSTNESENETDGHSTEQAALNKEAKNSTVQDRIMSWYADQLMRPVVKGVVLVFFTLLLGICTWRASLLTQEFQVTDMIAEDSYVTSYANSFSEYSPRKFPVDVYFRDVDQSDETVQDEMMSYVYDLVSLPEFGEEPPFCWVRDYKLIVNDEQYASFFSNMTFNQQLDSLLGIPTLNQLYGGNIIRDEDSGKIIASRCQIFVCDLDFANIQQQTDFFLAQRHLTRAQPVNAGRADNLAFFSYKDIYHAFEFMLVQVEELISTGLAGSVAVFVISIIFVPHWSALFFITPVMAALYVDLLGMIQLFGLHINVITYISLVIAMGLLIDFTMHVLISYYESSAKTRDGKVKDLLQTVGSSILVGGLSTFLGVLPLAASSSAMIKTIYLCFFGMITLGISHGLILLPVLLSLFGPNQTVGSDSEVSVPHQKPLEKVPARSNCETEGCSTIRSSLPCMESVSELTKIDSFSNLTSLDIPAEKVAAPDLERNQTMATVDSYPELSNVDSLNNARHKKKIGQLSS